MFTGIVQRVGTIKKLEKAADSTTFFLATNDDFFQGMDKGASVKAVTYKKYESQFNGKEMPKFHQKIRSSSGISIKMNYQTLLT